MCGHNLTASLVPKMRETIFHKLDTFKPNLLLRAELQHHPSHHPLGLQQYLQKVVRPPWPPQLSSQEVVGAL